jgi:hypothetical protein
MNKYITTKYPQQKSIDQTVYDKVELLETRLNSVEISNGMRRK